MGTRKQIYSLVAIITWACWMIGSGIAQESAPTPSDKTKEAVDKVIEAPAAIGKTLRGISEAAKDKLRQVLGGKSEATVKPQDSSEQVELNLPRKAPQGEALPPALTAGTRDPFRPMTLRAKVRSRARENLSPLERLDLSQLKVVGIIWDIKEPRAMVEDTARLGYVVKVGTPIGSNDGKVKAIHRNQVVIEESAANIYGVRRKRDVIMKLATE